MLKRFCEHCKDEIERVERYNIPYFYIQLSTFSDQENMMPLKNLDFCSVNCCSLYMKKWIDGYINNAGSFFEKVLLKNEEKVIKDDG